MVNMRKRYDATFRAKVALEVVKGEKTLAKNHHYEKIKEIHNSDTIWPNTIRVLI